FFEWARRLELHIWLFVLRHNRRIGFCRISSLEIEKVAAGENADKKRAGGIGKKRTYPFASGTNTTSRIKR
ncbi:MAG: hypothetical protein AB1750_05355, partial [Chloroflexota bacterium]